MADVPDQPVARRVEHVMQRDRQFDDAQTCAQMPASDRNRVDRLRAQFVGDLSQVRFGQAAESVGIVDLVEERRTGNRSHIMLVRRRAAE